MLGQRLRRWPTINPALGEHVLFTGRVSEACLIAQVEPFVQESTRSNPESTDRSRQRASVTKNKQERPVWPI